MSVTQLALVESTAESPATRAKRLLLESHEAAAEHLRYLNDALRQVGAMAVDVAQGGEAYPAGARELCRRLAEELAQKVMTLEATSRRDAA
ncbi:MAG: hypothetical protein ABIO39_05710 [Caulobacteraceae bacterium]